MRLRLLLYMIPYFFRYSLLAYAGSNAVSANNHLSVYLNKLYCINRLALVLHFIFLIRHNYVSHFHYIKCSTLTTLYAALLLHYMQHFHHIICSTFTTLYAALSIHYMQHFHYILCSTFTTLYSAL